MMDLLRKVGMTFGVSQAGKPGRGKPWRDYARRGWQRTACGSAGGGK